jgi:hypothetical protein
MMMVMSVVTMISVIPMVSVMVMMAVMSSSIIGYKDEALRA